MQNATDLPILTAAQLMAAGRRPRSDLLPPWLASDTRALVYGPPGIGKSFLALGIAWAVASGGSFLGWRAPRPRRVLYVDGEMGAAELSDRLALFGPLPDRLSIVPHDRPGGARLDLGGVDGIVRLMAAWNDPQLLVLDTLSALTPSARADRDPERRDGLDSFLLHLKQSRRAVLMVDHADRRGAPNGRARHSSAADLVMALRPPGPGAVCGNARFEIHFEKTRQRVPLFPILAELQTVDGAGAWRWDAACRVDRLAALVTRGVSRRDVCEALGIERSWFFRLKAEARARGLLPPKGTS
ncbi:MAG: AAA family ATPase [Proteobacteria bacterium]|nr:AAA family ATPase [Pseudomonadota bacterium]